MINTWRGIFTQPRKSSWPPDLALCAICLKNLPSPFTPRTSFNLLTASNTEDSSSWSLKLCLSGRHKHLRHREETQTCIVTFQGDHWLRFDNRTSNELSINYSIIDTTIKRRKRRRRRRMQLKGRKNWITFSAKSFKSSSRICFETFEID